MRAGRARGAGRDPPRGGGSRPLVRGGDAPRSTRCARPRARRSPSSPGADAGDREAALKAAAGWRPLAEDPIVAGLLVEEAARTMAFDGRALQREVDLRRTGKRRRCGRRRDRPRRRRPLRRRPHRTRNPRPGCRARRTTSARRWRWRRSSSACSSRTRSCSARRPRRWIRRGSGGPRPARSRRCCWDRSGRRPGAPGRSGPRARGAIAAAGAAPRRATGTARERAVESVLKMKQRELKDERCAGARRCDGPDGRRPAETIAALLRGCRTTAAALRALASAGGGGKETQ